ncbi:LuxR C-terminal-related transcriptional regulator [Rhodococcus sp. P1Y]|uniref:LuxR C-terminal-related transcriptional regulator n=1 Tax=Rhodococcus sp. P1Y TaxID=1302308 RepID=UPI00137A4E46|nr:LuxR C-terminal-related transcriptional regulator [Rhodococcus sp. P1Y]
MSTSRRSPRRTGNLPAELTNFVGRRRALESVTQLLSSNRLVTLTGPGGVGKSRLAVEVAEGIRRRFPDGVWLVELAEIDDPLGVSRTIARVLDVRDQSHGDPIDTLGGYLQSRRVLLVLDNCEHLAAATATVAHTLLRFAPQLRILTTSRQALGVNGEHVHVLPPLTSPAGAEDATVAELLEFEAVQLFLDRSRSVAPDFEITDENRSAVRVLCSCLDGIPLAIELASARLRSMTIEQIASRVEDLPDLLSNAHGATGRQQALNALMNWSFQLCTPAEQEVWTRVSVFVGSFDLAAATAVCERTNLTCPDVLAALAGLVDKSVLVLAVHPDASYRFLEPIRQFGRAELNHGGKESETRQLHCGHFAKLVAQSHLEEFGPNQLPHLRQMRHHHADICSAMQFAMLSGRVEAIVIAGALRIYWHSTGSLTEGRSWLAAALDQHPDADYVRAQAQWADTWLALMQGDTDSAVAETAAGLVLSQKIESEHLRHRFGLASGVASLHSGDLTTAAETLQAAYLGCESRDDLVGMSIALVQLALTSIMLGDYEASSAYASNSVQLSERNGESWYKAHAHWALSISLWRQGKPESAVIELNTSIELMTEFGERLVLARSFEVLGWIATDSGEFIRGAQLIGMSTRLWDDTGAALSAFGRLDFLHEECVAKLDEELGTAGLREEMRHGASSSLHDAINFALNRGADAQDTAEYVASGLTAEPEMTKRESQVAELIAIGKSNKEIATALSISIRTVEAHVEHIFNKFDFTSRTQIAVWQHARK